MSESRSPLGQEEHSSFVYSELLNRARQMDEIGFHSMGRFLDWIRSEYTTALQATKERLSHD